MKKIVILSAVLVLLGLSSCTMYNKSTPAAHIESRINFQSSDLEYVGEVSGTATQLYFLGIPYGGRFWYTANTGGNDILFRFRREYNNALYDALSQKPDADFVLPISSETVTDMGFLGRKVTMKVKAKAFKIKTQ